MKAEEVVGSLGPEVRRRYPSLTGSTTAATVMAIVRLHETDGDITKKRILEEIDRRYGTPPKGRARLFADTEPVIREAVAEMRRDQTKLAWLNGAARITKMTDVYVSTSTLHDWCRRDKLPHPGQPYWQRPARQV